MDKETLSNYGWIVICVLVLAVMIALATPFGNFIKDAVWSTTKGLFDTNESALNVVGLSVAEESLPELSDISSIVFQNTDYDGIPANTRAMTCKYFYVPVTPGTTVNVTNNSAEFKVALHTANEKLGLDYDYKWCSPGSSKSFTLGEDARYIYLYFGRVDEKAIDVSTINLEDICVTYENAEKNFMDALLESVASYNKTSIKYNQEQIKQYYENIPISAHAGATDSITEKNTLQAIKNAVESENFESVEFDIRVTKDNILVACHDDTLPNSSLKINQSTLEELKAEKPNLATIEEILAYCESKNVSVVLDVKNIGNSLESVENLFSLIEKYNLQNDFCFSNCPQFLLDNLPEKYKNTKYSLYTGEFDSYIGNSNVYYSYFYYAYNMEYFISLLNSGHKYFEMFDDSPNYNDNQISLISYLCWAYDANVNITFFDKVSPVILSEQDLLMQLPKSVWEKTNLTTYR